MITAIGWAATGLGLFGAVPQVYRLIKTHNNHGVSSSTYVAWMLTALYWGIWGASVHSVPMMVIDAVTVPIIVTAIVLTKPTNRVIAIAVIGVALSSVGFIGAGLLAVLGSIAQIVIGLPQLRKTLAPRADLSGVTAATWVIITINSVLFVIYNALIGHALAAIAPFVASATATAVVIRVTLSHRRSSIPSTATKFDDYMAESRKIASTGESELSGASDAYYDEVHNEQFGTA